MRTAILIIALVATSPAHTDMSEWPIMLEACEQNERLDRKDSLNGADALAAGVCMGYVRGYGDALNQLGLLCKAFKPVDLQARFLEKLRSLSKESAKVAPRDWPTRMAMGATLSELELVCDKWYKLRDREE